MKNQIIENNYAIYNWDCMEVMPTLPDASVDLVVYSPPFAWLYNYSSDPRDMSNCDWNDEFLSQFEFCIKELARITKPWRINAVHVTDIHSHDWSLYDFPHDVIKLHEANWFTYQCKITVRKEPLKVRTRTMVQSLMHKFIIEDSTKCFPAMPDYILLFKRKWENQIPVEHKNWLKEYAWDTPILQAMMEVYNRANETNYTNPTQLRNDLNLRYKNDPSPHNKLSHFIRQRYASAIWDDIRVDNVLPYRDSKEEDDEKHVHPLQLDVIDRIVELYSNQWEVVLTPFMWVWSEVYSPVSHGRKAIGIELKDSYFKQAKINLELAEKRFQEKQKEVSLFD